MDGSEKAKDHSPSPPDRPTIQTPELAQDRYIHSNIYDRLVQDEDDLSGLVAYGLYQAEKRRWISQFQGIHSRKPSEDEVKAFCFAYDDKRLAELRSESQALIFKVTETRIEERITDIAYEAYNTRTIEELNTLKTSIKDISGYKHHVLAHILSFVFLVGIYYFITFAVTHEPSILGLFQGGEPASTSPPPKSGDLSK